MSRGLIVAADMARKPASRPDRRRLMPAMVLEARQPLYSQAALKLGQTIVIHGAVGNGGSYAVQLAHEAEARVIATPGASDIVSVRNLGADILVDADAEQLDDVAGEQATTVVATARPTSYAGTLSTVLSHWPLTALGQAAHAKVI